MITSAIVLVLMIWASKLAFKSQGSTALCFFLAGRSVGEFFDFLEKGGTQASQIITSSFSISPSLSFGFQASRLGQALPTGLSWPQLVCIPSSLWGPVGSDWTLQVPFLYIKNLDCTSHTPCFRSGVQPYCIKNTFPKMPQRHEQLRQLPWHLLQRQVCHLVMPHRTHHCHCPQLAEA